MSSPRIHGIQRESHSVKLKKRAPPLFRSPQEDNPFAELPSAASCFQVVQGRSADQSPCISLLMKRQYPLLTDSPPHALAGLALNILPSDQCAWKPGSQLILNGCACAPKGQEATELQVEILAPQLSHQIHVWGVRKMLAHRTHIRFSKPKPFTQIPLTLGYAFGGESQGFAFPPNPIGLGFHLRARQKELLHKYLPNLEDPEHPLEPAMIGAEQSQLWQNLPQPMHTGFVPSCFYPRSRWLQNTRPNPNLHFSAHLGLCRATPFRPSETITLKHCHGKYPHLDFALPDQHPGAWLHSDLGAQESSFVVQDIQIQTAYLRYSILWRADFPLPPGFVEFNYLQFGLIPAEAN